MGVVRVGLALLIATLIATSSGTVRASAALVQNNTATGTTSVTATWAGGAGVTAGHLLVATVAAASGLTIGAPAGWTLIGSIDNPNKIVVAMYYIESCSTKAQGATETFTTTGTPQGGGAGTTVRLMEFSGIVTTGALDVSGTATGGGNSLSVSTSGSVSTSPALGVAILAHQINDNGANLTANSPYSQVGTDTTTSANVEDTIFNVGVTSGGASTAAATASATGHSWAGVIATFQEAPLFWRGGLSGCASGSLFTNTACWSTSSGGASAGVAPGASDRANFDSGGTGNCALSSTAATQAGSITTISGYTGTITQGTQNVSLANDLSIGGGTFTGQSGQTIATNLSGSFIGGIVVSGGIFNGNGATITIQSLFISGGAFNAGAGTLTTNNGGVASFSGGTSTFAGGTSSFVSTLTTSGSSTIVNFGAGAPTVTGLATFNGGAVTFGSGQLLLNGGLDVEGATVTFGSSASTTTVTGTVLVGAGTVNFTNGAATTDFSNTVLFTQSGGTINVNGASVAVGSTITTASNNAFIQSGGTFNHTTAGGTLTVGTTTSPGVGGGGIMNQSGSGAIYNGVATATEIFNGPLNVSGSMSVGAATMTGVGGSGTRKDITITSGGTMTLSSAGFTFANNGTLTVDGTLNAGTGTATFNNPVSVTGTLNGASGTQAFAKALTVSGTLQTGTASMTGGSAALRLVTISSGGTMTLGAPGFTFNSTTAMPIAGTLNAAGTVSFAGPVTLTGTLNAGAATTTITGAVTMTGTSAFSGGTGTTTFTAAPTLTAGTFTVGTAGSSGSVILTAGATFASGMTLAFPTSGGTLSTPGGQTFAINGTVTSSAGTASTLPKIARSSLATGITVSFGATSVLNVNGLEFDNVVSTGVTIADGATYTLLERLSFKNNVANSTASGATHLVITSSNPGGTKLIVVSGCSFDATTQFNVSLIGVSGSTGVRAIFENQGTNGARAGESFDVDADTDDDNIANSSGATPFGSVVEWVYAAPSDTAGTAVGPPTPAFDFNTFAFYGVYATFKNTGGSNPDRVWMRSADGSAAYFYDVPDASGDIVGNPRFDTVNETTLGLDVNGDGDTLDTHLHVVYLCTSTGHIIKLIDNGTSLAPPTSGAWTTDFSIPSSVATITSPLVSDGTNLYFGGTDGAAATQIFGVQISAGANEKTVQKTIASVGAVTTAPTWAVYNGSTYLFAGSAASGGHAHVYRVQVSPGAFVDTDFSSSTSNVNGGVNFMNDRAYAVTDAGKLYVLDASSFTGGFTTLTGFPYSSVAASPIKSYPFVDGSTNNAYFGDNAGKLYVVTSAAADLVGYPYSIVGTPQLLSTPLYRRTSGTIAVGASDGYVYFVNRHDASNNPQIRKRYFVGTGSVSTISYNSNSAQYMAATSDGHMTYISAADVGTDSDGIE